MHYRNLWLILGAIYISFILAGSLLRVPEVNISFSYFDKVIHFLMYFFLVAWFVQLYSKLGSRIVILSAAIILGMLIEWLQGMTTYRSFDYADELANSIGAVSAFLLANTAFDSLLAKIDQWLYRLSAS